MTNWTAAILAFTTMSVRSTFADTVSSKLMIHIPHNLYKPEGYEHKEALFGMPPYGGSIAQNVYYVDSTLCDDVVDNTKGYPERENNAPWPSPFILMIDRGNCTFTKKVRNAQRAGAAGVLIADNTCLCSDKTCVSSAPCESSEPIMADDGSGRDISIPSFLVFKPDADLIKKEVTANQPVRAEMVWSLPSPDDRVEYDLWTVPSDEMSKDFLLHFKMLAIALGDRAYFTPHMYIYDGVRDNCVGNNGENNCANLCTNNGRYCATDPDGDLDSGVSGADVVHESLRRLCLWEHFGKQNGVGVEFWNYLELFNKRCDSPDLFADDKCVRDVYTEADIDGVEVERCMHDSGGIKQDAPNNKLDMEIVAQNDRGVVVLPTAYVNSVAIRGALTPSNVFTAICAGFVEGSKPPVCHFCSSCSDAATCVQRGYCATNLPSHIIHGITHRDAEGEVSINFFSTTLMFCFALFIGLGAWHYNKTRIEMREHVRGILAEYMPLDDGPGDLLDPMDFAQGASMTPLVMDEEQHVI